MSKITRYLYLEMIKHPQPSREFMVDNAKHWINYLVLSHKDSRWS